ncbi:MAG: hypothetical protein IJA48_04125 [Oscillospiraceae bacterium]|nr:hypothetical protein [Oscillospiraceae bacterium]
MGKRVLPVIRTISYVQSANGPVAFDSLSAEDRQQVATQLKITYLNELFRGKAVFSVKGGEEAQRKPAEA